MNMVDDNSISYKTFKKYIKNNKVIDEYGGC